jgi:chromosome transmission fidelity protein 1
VLSSRSNLCLNEQVRRRGGDLDETCRELLNGTELQSFMVSYWLTSDMMTLGEGCSYLPREDEGSQLNELRDSILVRRVC